MKTLELLEHQIVKQNEARREWVIHDTQETLASMIREERAELDFAIEHFDFIQNPDFEVASEVGDVGYLALKYRAEHGNLPPELQADFDFAREIAERVGLDMSECIEMKLLRNAVKYPDTFSSNGWGYQDARRHSKSLYQVFGGDKRFYQWYDAYLHDDGAQDR